MHSTYANDYMDCMYPFLAGQSYPFPPSLITYLSLCIHSDWTDMASACVGITDIMVSGDRVFIVASYGKREINGGVVSWHPAPLGYFDVDLAGGKKDAVLHPYADDHSSVDPPMATGNVTIGMTVGAKAEYSGFWPLDPSCVMFTDIDGGMYSYYGEAYAVNGADHAYSGTFTIDTQASNPLTMSLDSEVSTVGIGSSQNIKCRIARMTASHDPEWMWQRLYDPSLDTQTAVDSINGKQISTLSPGEHVYKRDIDGLVFKSYGSIDIRATPKRWDGEHNDEPYPVDTLAISVTGTKEFPTCVPKADDKAWNPFTNGGN